MAQNLTPEEVAILIRAKRIQKEKGIKADASVSGICGTAGISRKTGYQWAAKYETDLLNKQKELTCELSNLKCDHDQLRQDYDDLNFEHEGLQLAWEIHRVDEMLAEKKKHKRQKEQVKAVKFLRNQSRPTRLVAWALRVSSTTLIGWNQYFDENLCPYKKEETRGKSGKVTSGIVRQIVDQAKKQIVQKK